MFGNFFFSLRYAIVRTQHAHGLKRGIVDIDHNAKVLSLDDYLRIAESFCEVPLGNGMVAPIETEGFILVVEILQLDIRIGRFLISLLLQEENHGIGNFYIVLERFIHRIAMGELLLLQQSAGLFSAPAPCPVPLRGW